MVSMDGSVGRVGGCGSVYVSGVGFLGHVVVWVATRMHVAVAVVACW